jgi:hypothetical protein
MSDRAARMIVLCEDLQHATFIRRLLKQLGFPKGRIRINRSHGGAADQYVRNRYSEEVEEYRRRSARIHIGLVTAIDADENQVQYRLRQLNEELDTEDLDGRKHDEEICILVPKRNIETWIYALRGQEVNEKDAYPKLEKESRCQPAVDQLVEYLRHGIPDDLIPSLERGCRELNDRLPE